MSKSQIDILPLEPKPNIELKPIVIPSAQVLPNPLLPAVPLSETYLMDCIEGMKHYPDKWFDLAVVDVEYGISVDEWMAKDSNTQRGKSATKRGEYTAKGWDKQPPNIEYFYQLFRCSKNQIVWGANHFISRMPYDSSCWLVWDKENGENGYADCELAWTSFSKAVRMVKYKWHGMLQKDMKNKEVRIHPTQKPVGLYDWIFAKFGQPDMKILDTHLGSGSSRIAAHKNNLNFVGFEIDKEYFDKQEKRFANYVCQPRLF
jgi:site-specific DNA-methyltransferase (adenine-specific)